MTTEKPIIDALIFDSGVGGLSILGEILRARPRLSFIYLADNAGLPYGDKSAEWLMDRVREVINRALRLCHPRLLVVACNTASTLVLPQLRAELGLPVVGVVPAIKPAAALTRNKVIGLLATPATIARPYTDELIRNFAEGCHIIRVGSSRLVELTEKKLRGQSLPLDELSAICQPFITAQPRPDILVLGCTHFPLLQDELLAVLPGVALVDSGLAIAQRVQHLLGPDSAAVGPGRRQILFTAMNSSVDELGSFLNIFGLSAPTELA